jgi:GNAT superfamily N-acetyltransferase
MRQPVDIVIRPFAAAPLTAAQSADLDAIFFSSSATQTFDHAAEKAAFRERWLGRYLLVDATHSFLAMDRDSKVVGYLVGTIGDLARLPRFADIASVRVFAPLSALYPAHLHINLAADVRSQGIGARLVEAFADRAIVLGAPGMHVVTNPASRNVSFYERCGFHEAGRANPKGRDIVFLARAFPGGYQPRNDQGDDFIT